MRRRESVIQDLDQDGRREIVMNLREERMLGVSVSLRQLGLFPESQKFSGGPDVDPYQSG